MKKRIVKTTEIENAVKELCLEANTVIRDDMLAGLEKAARAEKKGTLAADMMAILIENAEIAREHRVPLCHDTGIACVFLEIGINASIEGASLKKAVNNGVERGYRDFHMRKSVVADPVKRDNTGTNTPVMVHIDIVEGNRITLHVMPKGFGSENKSRVVMLNPTAGPDEIMGFCVETVELAGPDACPPYVLGVGIGGSMDVCALNAKKALLRRIDEPNPLKHFARMEREVMKRCNDLGIGIMGMGGKSTVIGVNMKEAPTHIAGLPVAVNVCCHALRSASRVI